MRKTGKLKPLLWFVLGSIVGPMIVFGILYLKADKSIRKPMPTEGPVGAMPFGAHNFETLIERLPQSQVDDMRRTVIDAFKRGSATKAEPDKGIPTYSILALSGGGSNGAFGSGLLCGWTAAGTRPEFQIVTGVSAGALQSTFAFLGSDYDRELKEIFTLYDTDQIRVAREALAPLVNDALYDTAGFKSIIDHYVTDKLLAAVAAKHAAGNRLYVGTTNMDTSQFVIWDMGEIASSGKPGAREKYRDVLLASASVPVLFPPVYLEVEENGKLRYEMHADGGALAQVFFRGPLLAFRDVFEDATTAGRIKATLYVIRNGKLIDEPTRRNLDPRVAAIATRTIENLFEVTTDAQLYRAYVLASRYGVDFNLASIPVESPNLDPTDFNRKALNDLFNLGYRMAEQGHEWRTVPPGLDQAELFTSDHDSRTP